MESVFCPNCDIDIGQDNVCPSCGWINIPEGEVDNKDAISKMFGSDKDDNTVVVGSEELSPEQIAAFQSGHALEFLPGGDDLDTFDNFPDGEGFPIPDIDSIKEEIAEEKANFKKERINNGEEIKKPKTKPVILRIIIIALTAVTAFFLGGACLYLYNELQYTNEVYSTAYEAVLVVSAKAPQGKTFKATEVYVKTGVEKTCCIIYGEFISAVKEHEVTYFRLEINNLNPEKTILYYAFDENEYNRLKNGSDENKIKASIMKSYYDMYLRYVEEIKSGGFGWKTANVDYLNLMLNKE